MGLLRILLFCGAALLLPMPVQAGAVNEWTNKSQAFTSSIKAADRKGDYAKAVELAKQCMALPLPDSSVKRPFFYCEYYYGKALINGVGTTSNEDVGFRLLKESNVRSLDMAELYERHDPVEAYAIVLGNYAHNLCDETGDGGCDRFYKHRESLDDRLRSELSVDQIREAEARALKINPDILANRRWFSIFNDWLPSVLAGVVVIGAFAGVAFAILWLGKLAENAPFRRS